MKRRAFIASLTGGLLAAPLAAEAQPHAKVYRIGFLRGGPRPRRGWRLSNKVYGRGDTSTE